MHRFEHSDVFDTRRSDSRRTRIVLGIMISMMIILLVIQLVRGH